MRSRAQRKVEKARSALDEAIADQQEERRRRRVRCSCGKMHPIGKLELIVTHYYHEPHGCTGGDYWSESEWQFVCPHDGTRNRLLFDDYALDWKERDGDKAGAPVFKAKYRGLFGSTRDVYDNDDASPGHYNNYYIDEHRERFELPAKPKR